MALSLYAMGALGLVAAAAVGYATLEHSWRQNAELREAQEKEANVQNQRTIRLLRKSNEIFEEIAADLRLKADEIAKKEEEENEAITGLEGTDEEVRRFLATPIPARLKCLLNNEKCPNGTAGGDRNEAGPVQ